MGLTEEQQLEMYTDIKVIKNNCVCCKKIIDKHDKKIDALENSRTFIVGVCAGVSFVVSGITALAAGIASYVKSS